MSICHACLVEGRHDAPCHWCEDKAEIKRLEAENERLKGLFYELSQLLVDTKDRCEAIQARNERLKAEGLN